MYRSHADLAGGVLHRGEAYMNIRVQWNLSGIRLIHRLFDLHRISMDKAYSGRANHVRIYSAFLVHRMPAGLNMMDIERYSFKGSLISIVGWA